MTPEPKGRIEVEVGVHGGWAISYLTKGWSDEEKQRLLDGDEDALEGLRDAALEETVRHPDLCDGERYTIHWMQELA